MDGGEELGRRLPFLGSGATVEAEEIEPRGTVSSRRDKKCNERHFRVYKW